MIRKKPGEGGGGSSLNKSSKRGKGSKAPAAPGCSLPPPSPRARALPSGAMRAYKFARVARARYKDDAVSKNGRKRGPAASSTGFPDFAGRAGERVPRAKGVHIRTADAAAAGRRTSGTGPVHPSKELYSPRHAPGPHLLPPSPFYPFQYSAADTHRHPPGSGIRESPRMIYVCICVHICVLHIHIISLDL